MNSGTTRNALPRTVVVLGLVSFFNDLASEIVIPLIPILLATVLSAGPIALGLIEGIADAVASLLKLWSGRHSDRLGGRRKTLTLSGYLLSNLARPLLAFAGHWAVVLVLRSIDRIGKGLRSAPRDALVADSTPPHLTGYAFGYQRALDNGGAVFGALLAAGVIAYWALPPASLILWSAVPGAVAVLLLAVGVKERAGRNGPAAPAVPPLPPLRWRGLSAPLRRYLWALALFTTGRASETFIILRSHELGSSVAVTLLLWAAMNLAKAATATWGGRHSDRLGRANTLLISWGAFGLGFLLLAQVDSLPGLWAAACLYGLFAGFGEGAERAQINDFANAEERGTAFGWYYLMSGLAAIPAGALFGVVWHYFGAGTAFAYAGLLVLAAALLLRVWVDHRRAATTGGAGPAG